MQYACTCHVHLFMYIQLANYLATDLLAISLLYYRDRQWWFQDCELYTCDHGAIHIFK